MSLRGGVLWLLLLSDVLLCICARNHHACRHDKHAEAQRGPRSVGKLCRPSAGAITQRCSRGFYREWSGPDRGRCVPCRCGGLSDECDDHTGKCLNCQFNTAGDHCERCKEGYYGNAADRTCRGCPCPFAWSNAALACTEGRSGEVECLCKRSHAGARCEKCASGYYGDPTLPGGSCKPCDCNNGDWNICDSLTGECIAPGDGGLGDHCQCDSCTDALWVDSDKADDALALLNHQLQNVSHLSVSLSWLKHLEANISDTRASVGRYAAAVRRLDPKVEQLETDVNVARVDLNQLIDETSERSSYVEKVLRSGNATWEEAEKLLTEAEALLTATRDLISELTEMKVPVVPSGKDQAMMVAEAERLLGEMKERSCTSHMDRASKEGEEAKKLLASINMTFNVEGLQTVLDRSKDSLESSHSPLRDLADLLSDAKDAVGRSQALILGSGADLQRLQQLRDRLQAEEGALRPVAQTAADLLKNVTSIHRALEDNKKDLERHLARLDGAKRKLSKNLISVHISALVEKVTGAEEHAEELSRLAADIPYVTNSSELLGILGKGPYSGIINTIEDADAAANQSNSAVSEVLEDGGLSNRAKELRERSDYVWANANKTLSDLEALSAVVNVQKDSLGERGEKVKSLQTKISALNHQLNGTERGDTAALLESAKRAASELDADSSRARERAKELMEDLERIRQSSGTGGVGAALEDAEKTLRSLTSTLPKLREKRLHLEALSRKSHPSANMSESIRRIKDVIAETRSFLNRLPLATTFNGKAHVELHSPRNPEDLKTFTSVDLLLNLHQSNPPERGRRRRQHDRQDADLFVFYLGGKNASGDYIGMAVRSNVLVCVYKLAGVAHQVQTSQVTTTTSANSSFDRVVFHRVYQDAGVNITHNFTSQSPVRRTPKRNLPNTMSGIFNLDPDDLVFYVGGYPADFRPPVELRYPNYRGTMRFSYINDQPLCLFNFKQALGLDAKQPTVAIPQAELSDYYEGTGYRMVLIKRPDKKKRLFKFHTNSRETNALLFYIGNEESFFSVLVERGLLILRGRQEGRELRAQSPNKVSLFDENFAITISDKFVVHYGQRRLSTAHAHTAYTAFYVGGLPPDIRQRFSISAPPLRGCVDHLTADAEIVEYSTTIGVSVGCPVSMLGVRAAALTSVLPADSMFAWGSHLATQRVSLGFKSTDRHGAILSSQSSSAGLQLSLADGCVVLRTGNHTLKSFQRYNDGRWHYLTAAKEPTRLELSVDNVSVNPGHRVTAEDQNSQAGKFQGCIANVYYRSDPSFIPADLSSFSEAGAADQCGFSPRPSEIGLLPAPLTKQLLKPKPKTKLTLASSWCGKQRSGFLLSERSWLRYKVPLDELNHRPHFSLDVKTASSKGRILYVSGGGAVPLLALYMANGKMKMSLGHDRIIQHGQRSNDGQWHRVEISVEKKTFHLLVDGFRVPDGVLQNGEGSSLDFHPHVYVGGDALGQTAKGHDIPMDGVSGCVRDFRLNNVAVGRPEASSGASLCLDVLAEAGAYFAGGHVVLENYVTVGSRFALAFEMRPQHVTGVLFHARSHQTSLSVFFRDDKVEVVANDGSGAVVVSVPARRLCDGEFHTVTVTKQHEVIKLMVDAMSDQKKGPKRPTHPSKTPDTLYIGGAADQPAPVSSPFFGCLRNVKVNGRAVAFGKEGRVVGQVNLNKCPAD